MGVVVAQADPYRACAKMASKDASAYDLYFLCLYEPLM